MMKPERLLTDEEEIERLRWLAHDGCGLLLKAFKERGGDPMETIPLHQVIDKFAALARRLVKQRFGEHTLAREWEGRASALDKDVEVTIQERDAARRLHDEHCLEGPGPRCTPAWRKD